MASTDPLQPDNLLATLSERAAASPLLETAVMLAVRATLPGVIQGVLREMFPGETIRIYIPKIGAANREQRDASVANAIESGLTVLEAAKRTGVPETTVRRINKRRRGNIGRHFPP